MVCIGRTLMKILVQRVCFTVFLLHDLGNAIKIKVA